MKVLTVAIPVYNTEKYLKRCFDSVLIGEILDDIEIVAVNDGSKDHSIDILKDYEGRYPGTVVVVDKENGGHGSAVNAALDHATGRYFRVLDSDDWFFSGDFVEMVRRLRSEKADVVISNYAKEFVYDGRTEDLVWKDLEDGVLYNFDTIDLEVVLEDDNGKVIKNPCQKCRGVGRVRVNKAETITIPAGTIRYKIMSIKKM